MSESFFDTCVNWSCVTRCGCRTTSSTLFTVYLCGLDFIGSIFQPFEMASYIRDVREQNAIKIFSLTNRKISLCVFSLCAKWTESCPNPVNISTTWKNLRSFLSILDRMQWAKKPSHATVPLNRTYKFWALGDSKQFLHCFIYIRWSMVIFWRITEQYPDNVNTNFSRS